MYNRSTGTLISVDHARKINEKDFVLLHLDKLSENTTVLTEVHVCISCLKQLLYGIELCIQQQSNYIA